MDCDATQVVPATKKILTSMEVKALRRKSALSTSQLFKSENLVLCELNIEQVFQILRASLVIHAHALKNGRIRELIFPLFRNQNFLYLCSRARDSCN